MENKLYDYLFGDLNIQNSLYKNQFIVTCAIGLSTSYTFNIPTCISSDGDSYHLVCSFCNRDFYPLKKDELNNVKCNCGSKNIFKKLPIKNG